MDALLSGVLRPHLYDVLVPGKKRPAVVNIYVQNMSSPVGVTYCEWVWYFWRAKLSAVEGNLRHVIYKTSKRTSR